MQGGEGGDDWGDWLDEFVVTAAHGEEGGPTAAGGTAAQGQGSKQQQEGKHGDDDEGEEEFGSEGSFDEEEEEDEEGPEAWAARRAAAGAAGAAGPGAGRRPKAEGSIASSYWRPERDDRKQGFEVLDARFDKLATQYEVGGAWALFQYIWGCGQGGGQDWQVPRMCSFTGWPRSARWGLGSLKCGLAPPTRTSSSHSSRTMSWVRWRSKRNGQPPLPPPTHTSAHSSHFHTALARSHCPHPFFSRTMSWVRWRRTMVWAAAVRQRHAAMPTSPPLHTSSTTSLQNRCACISCDVLSATSGRHVMCWARDLAVV